MPYQPSSPSPYLSSIDANNPDGNTFSCLLNSRDNGNIFKYVLNIYDFETGDIKYHYIDSNTEIDGADCWINVIVDASSVLTNGKDYVWNIMLCNTVETPSTYSCTGTNVFYIPDYYARTDTWIGKYVVLIGSNNENHVAIIKGAARDENSSDAYKIKLTFDTQPDFIISSMEVYDFEDSITSPDYYFIARTTPEVNFSITSPISSSILDVDVTYSQEEGCLPAFYGFKLYQGTDLIHDTGNIYSSQIKYRYEGLISGEYYSLELNIVDDNRNQIMLTESFYVEYVNYPTLVNPITKIDNDRGCVYIDFTKNNIIAGNINNPSNYEYKAFKNSSDEDELNQSNGICLDTNNSIYWNKIGNYTTLNLEDTTQLIHWHGHYGFSGVIFEKIDEENPARNITIRADGLSFYYQVGQNPEIKVNAGFELIDGCTPGLYGLYGDGTESAIYTRTDATSEPDDTELQTILETVEEDKLYILSAEDEIGEWDYIRSNDMFSKYWWLIIITKNDVSFVKTKAFIESEV